MKQRVRRKANEHVRVVAETILLGAFGTTKVTVEPLGNLLYCFYVFLAAGDQTFHGEPLTESAPYSIQNWLIGKSHNTNGICSQNLLIS